MELRDGIFSDPDSTNSSNEYEDMEEDVDIETQGSSEEELLEEETTLLEAHIKDTSKKGHKDSKKNKEKQFLSDAEIVPSGLGAPLPTPRDKTSNNAIRDMCKKTKMVDPLPCELPVSCIDQPPIDPQIGKRPLQLRSVNEAHVSNLKLKMKSKPTPWCYHCLFGGQGSMSYQGLMEKV